MSAVSDGVAPTGSAHLYWNGNDWGANGLSNGTAGTWAGFNWQSPGVYSVTGTYSGDGNYNNVSLSGATVTIQKATPSLSVSCSPNPITYGSQATNCTSSISGGTTGSIVWTINGSAWTTTGLNGSAGGFNSWGAGTATIGVTYAGDGNNNPASSSTVLTIVKATPSGSISCSPSTITYSSQSSTCTATVAAVSGGATPTGGVNMYWNGNGWLSSSLSSGSVGQAFGGQPAGGYTFTGNYGGDGNYNGIGLSAGVLTIQKATPSLSVSCSPNPITYGSQYTFCTASVSNGATGTVNVTFNGASWGIFTLASGSVSFPGMNTQPATNYNVVANYSGDSNNNASSGSTTLTINKATPGISVSCSPGSFPYSNSTPGTTCTPSISGGTSGSLNWTIDGAAWMNGTPLTAAYSMGVDNPVGQHTIGIAYSGDGNNNPANASTIVTVTQPSTTVSVSCSPGSLTLGTENTTCTASVPASDGYVTFYSPTTLTGEWWNGTTD